MLLWSVSGLCPYSFPCANIVPQSMSTTIFIIEDKEGPTRAIPDSLLALGHGAVHEDNGTGIMDASSSLAWHGIRYS